MVKREISTGAVVVYLLLWWAAVAGLFVVMTMNDAPTAPTIAWKETPLRTTTRMALSVEQEAFDPNGDKIHYFYEWSIDGEPIEHVGSSWSNKETRKGQVYEVRVIPDDGTRGNWGCSLPWRACAGEAFATLKGEIENSPPRARIQFVDPSIDPDAEVPEGESKPDPRIESYGRRTDVALKLSCFDPDVADLQRDAFVAAAEAAEAAGAAEVEEDEEEVEEEDPCTYTVKWFPADVEITEETEPVSTEPVLESRTLRDAEGWKVQVIANDGEDDGDVVEAVIYAEG